MPDGHTVILGGGLAGLAAAAAAGPEAVLLEREPNVGGLCRQVRVEGFRVDAVPHVLHFQREDHRLWMSRLLGGSLERFRRDARVHVGGTFARYPFQAHLYGLPQPVVEDCVQGRMAVASTPVDTGTFERWIQSQFGAGIARHFMVPYNAKFWTLPPSELTCDWLEGLVPVPTASETLRGALAADPVEYGYNVEFWYPRQGGMGSVLAALAAQVADLRLGRRVVRIDTGAHRLDCADGESFTYRRLLTSLPLPELRRLLHPLPSGLRAAFEALRWVSVAVVHIGVRGPAPAPWHWAYVPDPALGFYRVGLPSHYAADAAPEGCHVLSAETSWSAWKPLDRARLVSDTVGGLETLGLIRHPGKIVMTVALEQRYGYPIYDRRYADATARIRAELARRDIRLIGRFGAWRYWSVEQTLADARRAATSLQADQIAVPGTAW